MMRWLLLFVAVCFAGCAGAGDDDPTGAGGRGGNTGAAGAPEPTVLFTTWTAQLNGGLPPSCTGPMNLTLTQPAGGGTIQVTGQWTCTESATDCTYVRNYQNAAWECFSYSGAVSGAVGANGAVQLSMATLPGYGVQMAGTMTSADITGSAAFSNAQVPFYAVIR